MIAIHINHLAVIVASAVYFIIGGLWYAPFLFGKEWASLSGLSEEKRQENLKKGGGMATFFAISFVAGLVATYAIACILAGFQIHSIEYGALAGLLVGFSFVFTSIGTSYMFAGKPFKLTIIDAGYQVVALAIAGAILGGWQ